MSKGRAPRKFLLLIAGAAGLLFAAVVWFTAPKRVATNSSARGARAVSRATTLGRAAWQPPPRTGGPTAEPLARSSPGAAPALSGDEPPAATQPPEGAAPQHHEPRVAVLEEGVRSEQDPRADALRQKLETIAAPHAAATIRFVTCDGDDCRARVEIPDPDEANRFIAAARRAPLGSLEIRMRERITAFNGRIFQADLKITGDGPSTM